MNGFGRKATEDRIKHHWIIIKELISVLNKIQFFIGKDCELNFVNNINLENLIFEMWNKKSKMKNLRDELKRTESELKRTVDKLKRTAEKLKTKSHFFNNLSEKYQNQFQNMSITFFDNNQKNDFWLAELHAMSTAKIDLTRVE